MHKINYKHEKNDTLRDWQYLLVGQKSSYCKGICAIISASTSLNPPSVLCTVTLLRFSLLVKKCASLWVGDFENFAGICSVQFSISRPLRFDVYTGSFYFSFSFLFFSFDTSIFRVVETNFPICPTPSPQDLISFCLRFGLVCLAIVLGSPLE